MTDRHGKPVTIGAACRFHPAIRDEWRKGTVRALRTDDTEARVDDGEPSDPNNSDFHVSAWVPKSRIEIRENE
jgi:hypothetical protein